MQECSVREEWEDKIICLSKIRRGGSDSYRALPSQVITRLM